TSNAGVIAIGRLIRTAFGRRVRNDALLSGSVTRFVQFSLDPRATFRQDLGRSRGGVLGLGTNGRRRRADARPVSRLPSRWNAVQARQTNRRRDSSMHQKAVAVLVALAAVAVALVVALPADAAGNPGTTQVSTFDPTGAVFACPGTDYTVLGGIVRSVFHDSIAANGSEHVTRTISPI